ncbi:kinase-like domain-containing protein [Nemania serpens]|nr:kinase-like domain-containing protein [Nemania serpens]
MAQALKELEKHDITHHDIKPANILYDKKNKATLIDFGLATKGNEPLHYGGTPWYIGPEYLNLANEREPPEDVWALGIVMLYMLRFIPLPESGLQVASWSIRRAMRPATSEHARMRKWHGIIETVVRSRLDEGNYFHNIVRQMLNTTARRRIVPSQITEALEAEKQRKQAEQQKVEALITAKEQEWEAYKAAKEQELEAWKAAKRKA